MTRPTVAVIDYGMGNLHSVASALNHVAPNADVIVTSDPAQVGAAERVIFPGVGAIRDCMAEIKRLRFDELLRAQIASGKPVLGICVGMQALMQRSEENDGVDCIGILPGQVKFFGEHHKDAQGVPLKVPHMGWNQVNQNNHPLWKDIPQDSRFYFVHSYYVRPEDATLALATTDYGGRFVSAIARGNTLLATQFHPEKSQEKGLQVYANFVAQCG